MINFSGGPLQKLRDRLTSSNNQPPPSDEDNQHIKEREARRAALIQQFRPNEADWLRLGLLFMFLQSCVVWEVLVLLSPLTIDLIVPGDRWLRAIIMPVLFLVGFYRGRWLAEWTRAEYWSVRAAMLVGLLLLARFEPYLLDPGALPDDAGTWLASLTNFLAPPIWINLALFLWMYLGGETIGRDALNLYARPSEVPVEQGGTQSVDDLGWVERQPSYRRLKNRIAINGFLVASGMAVPFLLMPGQPLDHGQVFPTSLLLLFYLPVAILTLSAIRLRYLQTIWRLGELAEPVGLPRRWLLYLVAFGVLIALVALVLPHSVDINPTGQANQSERPAPAQPRQALPTFVPNQTPPPRPVDPIKFPDWISQVFNWTVIILAVLLLLFILSRIKWSKFLERPPVRVRRPRMSLSWRAFVAWLKSLFKRAAWDNAPEDHLEGGAARRRLFSRFARDPFPSDPRAQVRYYYRQTLSKAARAGLPRRPPQTPREFAGDLRQRFETAEIAPAQSDPGQDSDSLRSLYEEARFSPHLIAPDQVEQAQERASRLNGALRQARKKKKE